jgi:hypothetical protein
MRAWAAARAAHQDAVAAFVTRAESGAADRWTRQPAPGKWSPAEIAEHLSLTYQLLLSELRGGTPFRMKGTWLLRLMVRYKFLPALLREGRIPPGVRAPREARPGPPGSNLADALARFRSLAVEFEEEITTRRASGGGTLTHPYFGRLDPDRGIRFVEVHIRHHTRQLEPVQPLN